MIFIVYKTTNNINGKIYIGCHRTNNLNDGYLGSGIIINQAINKYGTDKFSREIIATLNNSDDMFALEQQLVNEEFVQRADTYNVKLGGTGGWDHINGKMTAEQPSRRISNYKLAMTTEKQEARKQKLSETWAKKSADEKNKHCAVMKKAVSRRDEKTRISNFQKTMAARDPILEKIRKQKISDIGSKRWKLISPNGEVFVITGLRRFCQEQNLTATAMYNAANGHTQTKHPGWECQRL